MLFVCLDPNFSVTETHKAARVYGRLAKSIVNFNPNT